MRFLEEVGVFALLANLVVALDGLLGLVDVNVELLEQLVDGVGNLVVVGGLLDAFLHRLGMGSGRIGRRGAHSAERIPEHTAAELERCGVVGLEVGVENRPAVVVAAVDHGADALALNPGGLVHEALALGVHEQEGAMIHSSGLRVHHRGPRAVLEGTADPCGHVVAVTGVALVGAQAGHNLVRDGGELVDVLVVVAHVAGGEHDALGGVVLHVLALFVLADGAGDFTLVVGNELLSRHVVHELEIARLFSLGDEQVLDVRRDGDCLVFLSEVAAEDHVIAIDLGVHRGIGANGDHALRAIGLGKVEQPVHAALALAEPLGNEGLTAAVAAGGDSALHFDGLVEMDVERVERLRRDGARTANAVAVGHAVFLNQGDLGAILRGVQSAAGSRIAGANDEHFGLDGFGDIGDSLGGNFPRVLLLASGSVRLAARARRTARRAAAKHAERSHTSGGKRCALEQIAARNALLQFFHGSLLMESLGMPRRRDRPERHSKPRRPKTAQAYFMAFAKTHPPRRLHLHPPWMRWRHYRGEMGRNAPHIMGCFIVPPVETLVFPRISETATHGILG